ncbi:MAG: Unknown protein [uncultured Sulfurovum sp.]|uniref:DUF420 domain-containing protein n=1 Tax=uncultured Sulfurovum sp. TaxID=269237 RepID=A0A6S6T5V8_9BACT|nr:MAG: Unknown protein [uncultured Sulfurovum sp.]
MIEEYFTFFISQLALSGFWETRASIHMDIIISFLLLLPFLSGLSIFLAIRKHLKLHQVTQFLLFLLTLISLSFFAYFVHYLNSFEHLLQESTVDAVTALVLLVFHIIISTVTLVLWLFTLIYALSDKRRRALPGVYSESHAQSGKRVFKGILLITLSSLGMYWVLFIA